MKPMWGVGFAAVCARAVRAGIMASSSGSASVVPTPRKTVRRVRCFLVTNIGFSFCYKLILTQQPAGPGGPAQAGGLPHIAEQGGIYFAATCVAGCSTILDWNAGAATIPITMDENLSLSRLASFTIFRTVGIS